jgi:hypothetical protein
MNRLRHLVITLFVIASLFLIFRQSAYAFIDTGTLAQVTRTYYIGPGLGNLIAQILIGFAIGGAAMAGIYRVRVRNFLNHWAKRVTRRRHSEESELGQSSKDSH